jgi:hypothetical protein
MKVLLIVIPAKAGIQPFIDTLNRGLDSGFRRNDGGMRA